MTGVLIGTYINISENDLCRKWYIYKYFVQSFV